MVWLFCPGSKIARVPVQVWPPSVVLENQDGPRNAAAWRSASALWLGDTSRSQTAYAVPSGPMETQGSEARLYGVPVNGSKMAPGAQPLKGRGVSPQVLPPLSENPATKPCAPPFDQRSCCQTPMIFFWLAGLKDR